MAKNKMAEVAKLFGKKLDEEFRIKYDDVNRSFTDKFVFTQNGLRFRRGKNLIFPHDCVLEDLFTGQAVIVKDEDDE